MNDAVVAAPAYDFTDDWFSPSTPLFEKYLIGSFDESPCNLLEIGSYEGRATTWLIDNVMNHPGARLDTIDIHPNERRLRNIERTGRSSQVTEHVGMSVEVLRTLPLRSYDFIYVDGSHSTVHVLEDAIAAFRLAKVGAIIAFDDYPWDEPPWNGFGVPKPALDAFLSIYANSDRYEPLVKVMEFGWQLWVKKLADSRSSHRP